jgi:hypothetical protein
MKPLATRIRTTPATKVRDAKVRTIIAALHSDTLLRDEIRRLIGGSTSGTNKYLALLRAAGVIELDRYIGVTKRSPGHPLYRLNPDSEAVDAFLRSLDVRATRPAARLDEPVLDHQGRQVHHLEGDKPRACLAGDRIPAHEPVLAAFFGLNRTPQHA